ncbi:MAG TPA: response regulator [Bacteroidota bacterium]|nr:response regulator [Bacteroidota bacterium]
MEKQDPKDILVLLVENDAEVAEQVKTSLANADSGKFFVTWVNSGEIALSALHQNSNIDIVVTDYYLPGMNGVQFARAVLKEISPELPIVFLTTNNDLYVVVEAMKLGVKEYLFKESLSSNEFTNTLFRLVEKYRLRKEMEELEKKRRRLDAMQEIVVQISGEITEPLQELRSIVATLLEHTDNEKAKKYLSLIQGNVERMEEKLEKLRNLKDDKTVQYIKDIRMIDLS